MLGRRSRGFTEAEGSQGSKLGGRMMPVETECSTVRVHVPKRYIIHFAPEVPTRGLLCGESIYHLCT